MIIENPVSDPRFGPMVWLSWKGISEDFKPVVEKMFLVLLSNVPEKGLGWREFDDTAFYLKRIREEIEEFEKNPSEEEAADIANFGMMLVYCMQRRS